MVAAVALDEHAGPLVACFLPQVPPLECAGEGEAIGRADGERRFGNLRPTEDRGRDVEMIDELFPASGLDSLSCEDQWDPDARVVVPLPLAEQPLIMKQLPMVRGEQDQRLFTSAQFRERIHEDAKLVIQMGEVSEVVVPLETPVGGLGT